MNEQAKNILEKVYALEIVEYNCDILNNRMRFLLKDHQNIRIELLFKNVSCLYFINNFTKRRLNIRVLDDDEYLEYTLLNMLDTKVSLNVMAGKHEEWTNYIQGYANILIEISDKFILFEADEFEINGINYSIYN